MSPFVRCCSAIGRTSRIFSSLFWTEAAVRDLATQKVPLCLSACVWDWSRDRISSGSLHNCENRPVPWPPRDPPRDLVKCGRGRVVRVRERDGHSVICVRREPVPKDGRSRPSPGLASYSDPEASSFWNRGLAGSPHPSRVDADRRELGKCRRR